MFANIIGNIGLGLFIGIIFSLLYVSFDTSWKKVGVFIFSAGAGGAGLLEIYNIYNLDKEETFIGLGCCCFSFALTYIATMFAFCKLMKDKDDNDILRIRDIFLGQKEYINKYYECRAREIDTKLNIEFLKKREKEIIVLEETCKKQKQSLELERAELEKDKEDFSALSQSKLKINLPENKKVLITTDFLSALPSYVEKLASFIEGINCETELFIKEHKTVTYEDLRVFCYIIATQIQEQLFGNKNKDVRVHFRYYDKAQNGYIKFVSVIRGKETNRQLTVIPYDKANMIKKSYECKRALIKSHNLTHHYESQNSTIWTEYITGTFYNIKCNDIPCISFGISTKNPTIYRDLFNFLNYCQFETYLFDIFEKFNEYYNIVAILYESHTM